MSIVRLRGWLIGFWLLVLGIAFSALCVAAAVIPPFFVDSVVALGGVRVVSEAVGEPPRSQWRTSGSGFFYGYLVEDNPDLTKRRYAIYLVTARHVVAGFLVSNHEVYVRLNPKALGIEGRQFAVPNRPDQPGASTWFCHPDRKIDVAAVPMNFDFLKEQGIEPGFFASDRHSANVEKLKSLGVSAGDGIFVLGFPMGLSGTDRNYASFVRESSLA